jgi:hypothetical protein
MLSVLGVATPALLLPSLPVKHWLSFLLPAKFRGNEKEAPGICTGRNVAESGSASGSAKSPAPENMMPLISES